MKRGACPTLAAPMLTGDGWLVRFVPERLSGMQAAGLAAAAARLGNGRIEVTARGSVQVRGLTPATAGELAGVVARLRIEVQDGLVMVGALAGLDAGERDDPRPLAAALRGRVGGRALGPKAALVVDGGGALHLDGVAADVRVRALGGGAWDVVGVGRFDAGGAVEAALGAMGPGRAGGRDPGREAAMAVGRFALSGGGVAIGVGVPFGQMEAAALAELAAAVGDGELRPAAGRALLALGAGDAFAAAAARLGFVVEPGDPRLAIVACSGAPACASAHLATRALAVEIARARPELLAGVRLHLSGCAKRCAQPAGASVSLVAGEGGNTIVAEGMAVPAELRAFLEAVAPAAGRAASVPPHPPARGPAAALLSGQEAG